MLQLSTARRLLTYLYIYRIDTNFKWHKFIFILFNLSILLILVGQVVGSVAFVLFVSIDLEETLYAIYQILAWAPIAYELIIAVSLREKVVKVIDGVPDVSKSCKFDHSIIIIIFYKFEFNINQTILTIVIIVDIFIELSCRWTFSSIFQCSK